MLESATVGVAAACLVASRQLCRVFCPRPLPTALGTSWRQGTAPGSGSGSGSGSGREYGINSHLFEPAPSNRGPQFPSFGSSSKRLIENLPYTHRLLPLAASHAMDDESAKSLSSELARATADDDRRVDESVPAEVARVETIEKIQNKNAPDPNLNPDLLPDRTNSTTAQVLQALLGDWTFERTICHFNDDNRKESVTGDIVYTRTKAVKSSEPLELLYREDGLFHLPTRSLQVFREYEYVHNTHEGTLDIYFVEDKRRAHLFLRLRFVDSDKGDGDYGVWKATSDHLCVEDLYTGTFLITMREEDGRSLAKQVAMTYRVRGPNKDYESVTLLRPKMNS